MRIKSECRHARTLAGPALILCAVILCLPAARPRAQGEDPPPPRPRIGLALSGGGARGAAHIGVLKVLEELKIPIDFISGTSMGAIVGGLYASGMSPAELEEMISRIDWNAAFADEIPRRDRSFRRKRDDDLYLIKHKPGISRSGLRFPPGLLDGQKIDLLLKRYTLHVSGIRNFDDLPIPFRAVAADLATGGTVVIGGGDLALAIRASMSIPVVFAPREIDGRLLADGGVGSNLPIDVVRRMGADIVIAVDISTPLQGREELGSVLAITDQLITIMTRRNTDEQIASLETTDVFIRPDLGDITTASFTRAAEAIPAGFAAADSLRGRLAAFAVPAEEYGAFERRRSIRRAPPVIDEVRIVNHSRIGDGVIAARLHVKTGAALDVDRLEKDIDQIFGLELFESVYYDVVDEDGRAVLTITVRERSWGPNYMQFGVAVFEDFEGPNFNLGAAYIRTAVDRLNGEWRTGAQIGQEPGAFTEFHQPLDAKLRFFVQAAASISERADNIFDGDGRKIAELGVMQYGIRFAAGRELGTWGEFRAGVLRESGEIKTQVGPPDSPSSDFDTGEGFVQLSLDELDDAYFPRSGGTARLRFGASFAGLGADVEYEQGSFDGAYAASVGRWTGLIGASFGVTMDSDAPYQSLFLLGGFTRLSGLEEHELRGQHAALLSVLLYRRLGDFSVLSFYAGLSAEYGNTFDRREDIAFDAGIAAGSVFVGIETILGPVYIAYGLAEGDRGNYYLFLGKRP